MQALPYVSTGRSLGGGAAAGVDLCDKNNDWLSTCSTTDVRSDRQPVDLTIFKCFIDLQVWPTGRG